MDRLESSRAEIERKLSASEGRRNEMEARLNAYERSARNALNLASKSEHSDQFDKTPLQDPIRQFDTRLEEFPLLILHHNLVLLFLFQSETPILRTISLITTREIIRYVENVVGIFFFWHESQSISEESK